MLESSLSRVKEPNLSCFYLVLKFLGLNQSKYENGQATKGSWWIPWHTEAMKDVVTCDKSRGAGNTL